MSMVIVNKRDERDECLPKSNAFSVRIVVSRSMSTVNSINSIEEREEKEVSTILDERR